MGECGHPVAQDGGITPLEEHGQATPGVLASRLLVMARRPQECWPAVSLSRPVCLARAAASFFTSRSAPLCQPPSDSTASGIKEGDPLAPAVLLSSLQLVCGYRDFFT